MDEETRSELFTENNVEFIGSLMLDILDYALAPKMKISSGNQHWLLKEESSMEEINELN